METAAVLDRTERGAGAAEAEVAIKAARGTNLEKSMAIGKKSVGNERDGARGYGVERQEGMKGKEKGGRRKGDEWTHVGGCLVL